MSHNYILIGQTAVPCDDLLEWARWFEESDRRVALTEVGPYTVSTVFLGLDHNHARFIFPGHQNDAPILFETMAWITASRTGDPMATEWCDIQERCSTWPEAELQHKRIVAQLQQPGDAIKDLLAPDVSANQ